MSELDKELNKMQESIQDDDLFLYEIRDVVSNISIPACAPVLINEFK